MAAILFLIRNSLPVILMLMLLLKLGKSDRRCDPYEKDKIAETHVCYDRESNISYKRAINVLSYGAPDGVSQCNCSVYFKSGTNNVSVGYFTNSGRYDHCGIQVKLGNSTTFACHTERPANILRFNVIKFSRASNNSPNMCLTIRSATPLTIRCQPSPIDYQSTTEYEGKDSEDGESNEISTTKYSTTRTGRSSSIHKASTSAQSSTIISADRTTRRPSTITTTESSTRATISTELTELPIETTSSAVNGTTVSFVLPAEEHTDTAMLVGIFVPLTVTLIVLAAFCIRYKYKKHKKDSRPITKDSAIAQPLDTATNNRTTEDEEATVTYNVAYGLVIPTKADNSTPYYEEDTTVTYNVACNMDIPTDENAKKTEIPTKPDNQTELEETTVTYNVAYDMEIPPSYPVNNANTHNTGVNPDNVNDKTKDDDLVVTYNAMYSTGLDNEATGNSDRAAANEYRDSHIYHEINENMQHL